MSNIRSSRKRIPREMDGLADQDAIQTACWVQDYPNAATLQHTRLLADALLSMSEETTSSNPRAQSRDRGRSHKSKKTPNKEILRRAMKGT